MKTFKSGNYINQGNHRSFQPTKINQQWTIDDMEVLTLLSQADRQLGRLDMYSEYIPNIDLFISMHVLKEATQSSKIEGTKTNIEDALLDKEDVIDEKRDDWEEVQNYIEALNSAIKSLEKLPFSSRLIRETHKILLQGVRGKHKLPGAFRTSQNWIGGASINDATFIPPIHTSVNEYMSDLENFAHNSESFFPDLLKIALIHYQFETIHPFLDGNGRVGRLMITLYLVEKGILKKPILYLSDFFERNRMLYYDNLTKVREKNDLSQWFKFFLVGVIETAKSGINTFDSILKLQKEVEHKLQALGSRSHNAQLILNHLYQRPIINAQKAKELTSLSSPSVYKLIEELEKLEILTEITGGKRGKIYLFKDYSNLFK
ncbi:Fic family protein [Pseudotamlana carrageenivorans]|uniref:Cell filamentation protein Fic n=1 Tax=Pseudotamlana carrageenivorans TaxID=2069432 RepID=A0A2I7SI66_9FLAO|nr:Fic family protein [Tamlana carrageenivorans]AUS05591.1 cell filamentation protein Fic [Tamlana carrageenivorans]